MEEKLTIHDVPLGFFGGIGKVASKKDALKAQERIAPGRGGHVSDVGAEKVDPVEACSRGRSDGRRRMFDDPAAAGDRDRARFRADHVA
jgi:hypothetical protein